MWAQHRAACIARWMAVDMTPLMNSALSLAIGAMLSAPPILPQFRGTGESNFSGDSFLRVGFID